MTCRALLAIVALTALASGCAAADPNAPISPGAAYSRCLEREAATLPPGWKPDVNATSRCASDAGQ